VNRRPRSSAHPLDDAGRELAGDPRHVDFARRLANRYAGRRPRLADDIESAAMMGLVDAARTFDRGRGRKFTSHAYRRIIGEIQDCIRMSQAQGFRRTGESAPTTASFSALIAGSSGLDIGCIAEAGEDPVGWAEESVDAVRGMLAPLPAHVRRAMFLLYAEAPGGRNRVARKLGVSKSYVYQLKAAGLAELRRMSAAEALS
jgi:RNA polymerase sigma factor (sigma-70 family)